MCAVDGLHHGMRKVQWEEVLCCFDYQAVEMSAGEV
jgi:hypothetical protein